MHNELTLVREAGACARNGRPPGAASHRRAGPVEAHVDPWPKAPQVPRHESAVDGTASVRPGFRAIRWTPNPAEGLVSPVA